MSHLFFKITQNVTKLLRPQLSIYTYDAFGNITEESEKIDNAFKYAGEQYDTITGQYYLRARYYNPVVGRFITEDTYRGQIDEPQSLNLYTYVENNPINYIDPTGHCKDSTQGTGEGKLYPYIENTKITSNLNVVQKTLSVIKDKWEDFKEWEEKNEIETAKNIVRQFDPDVDLNNSEGQQLLEEEVERLRDTIEMSMSFNGGIKVNGNWAKSITISKSKKVGIKLIEDIKNQYRKMFKNMKTGTKDVTNETEF